MTAEWNSGMMEERKDVRIIVPVFQTSNIPHQ